MGISDLVHSGPALCFRILPATELRPLYDALICGSDLPPSREKQLFVDTGLIHLMVVSGSHLAFLEMLLSFLPRRPVLCALGFYCYLTGLQAPVVRAFLRRTCAPWLKEWSGLTALQIEAATVVIALVIYPPWILSRSFLMSWMCGLALCSPKIFARWPHFDQSVKAYFFLLPFCWTSPITVLWNTILAPFVGFILFPACGVAMVVPPLVFVSDGIWRAFMLLLSLGPKAQPLPVFLSSARLVWIPIVTHLFLLVAEVKWRRASAFSYSSTS